MDSEIVEQKKDKSICIGGNITGSTIVCGDIIEYLNPENVAMVVSAVTATIGVASTAIKGIQIWVDERKSRKIRIKYDSIELEIIGNTSEEEIYQKLRIFKKIKDELDKSKLDIKIIDE